MTSILLKPFYGFKETINRYRKRRWWENLRKMGMQLGKDINLPMSTWIDMPHCFLISIGDKCGFGEGCSILAHDAMPNEYINATRIGRVKIHESCHFGMRTVILPGVEIGPRSIVGSNSVVINDIPPETVAGGNPAKVICSLEHYLNKQQALMKELPLFPYKEYSIQYLSPEKLDEMLEKLETTAGFITGGYTAMEEEGACLYRT